MTEIVANHDVNVDVKEVRFGFRKDKLGNVRPAVELKLPTPSVEGLVSILNAGGKQLELLISAAQDIVISQARSILNDNESMTADNFPMDQVTWDYIANMPEAEKRGRGIAKEIWDAFAENYIAVMPGITGKSSEQVALAAKLFITKFQPVKTDKKVLRILQEQLAIYANNSSEAEQFAECIKFLSEKVELLLNAELSVAENL